MNEEQARAWITRGFTKIEDIVYVGLGLLLAIASIGLLVMGSILVVKSLLAGTLPDDTVLLLDRILLILLIVEIIYTVQVSFREHLLTPELFLLIGIIAVTRRILVLTAELPHWMDRPERFQNAIIELGLLTIMIIVLVVAIMFLCRSGVPAIKS